MTMETKYNIGDRVHFNTRFGEGEGTIIAISILQDEIGYEDAISYLIDSRECLTVDDEYIKAYEREIIEKVGE